MTGRKHTPSDMDIRIGNIISIQRQKMGMSQKDLAQILNVTFQQVQKYEGAHNRLTIGRLCQIAEAFEMTVGQLIDGANLLYTDDKTIMEIIKLVQTKMNHDQRRLILQISRQFTSVA